MSLDDHARQAAAALRADAAQAPGPPLATLLRRGRRRAVTSAALVTAPLLLVVVLAGFDIVAVSTGRHPASPAAGGNLMGTWTFDLTGAAAQQVQLPAGGWTVTLSEHGLTAQPAGRAEDKVVERITVDPRRQRLSALGEDESLLYDFACRTTGQYTWHRTGTQLRFVALSDECAARRTVLTAGVWHLR